MKTSILAAWSFPVLLAASFSPLFAATFHVDAATGLDLAGCGSPASPCASIQQAVNQAASTGDTILVAEGTYVYDSGLDPCTNETAVVCIVGKKLTILGGFGSGDWSQSDPAAHPTVIDGETFQRGVLVKRTFPNSPNGANLRLEGFTIRRGLAGPTPNRTEDQRGGGLKAALVDTLVLRDVRFEDNVAQGAATGADDGGNGAGGGAPVSSTESLPPIQVTLERVTFSGNKALGGTGPARGGVALGGGLFIDQSNVNASDLTFENNVAAAGSSPGSGLFGGLSADSLGGGMAILFDTVVNIQGLTATGNSSTGGNATEANSRGGVGGGGAIYVERSSLELQDARIQNNSSRGGDADRGGLGSGGGITTFDSTLVLERVAVIGNEAQGGDGPTEKGTAGGGGVYLNRLNDPSATATLLNSVIADNHVSIGAGGGIVGGGGGGVFVLRHDATIIHSTFARNSLGMDPMAGQAISVVSPTNPPGEATIEYSIIADHTSLTNVPAVNVRTDSSATFQQGLFAGNENNTNQGTVGSGTFTGLNTMLSAASADFVSPGPPNFDYHVFGSSPAVDQAIGSMTDLDLDGTLRSAPRDIGADEACSAAEDLVLSQEVVTGASLKQACHTITADAVVVESTGDLTLQAGSKVILEDGFRVETGGRLEVVIQLP